MSAEFKLSAAGREDVDVRMLGNGKFTSAKAAPIRFFIQLIELSFIQSVICLVGRPFCVELINPHRVNLTRPVMRKLQEVVSL